MGNNKKITILMIANSLSVNGISSVIVNYCSALSKEIFDVCVVAGSPVAECYKNISEENGFSICELPPRKEKTIEYYLQLKKEIKTREPDIVHVHGNSAMVVPELFISKLCGVRNRIMHCHNSQCNHMKLHKLLHPLFDRCITSALACSSKAGEWVFKDRNYTVLTNGFETRQFYFDENKRRRLRKSLNIAEEAFVLGHIGRFNEQKNQKFILDIFDEYASINPHAILILVGTGPMYEEITEKVKNHKYSNRVILYGETDNASSMYSAFDVFLFPSKFEGLGLVAVEAQISGLPCIISNVVPKEVDISRHSIFEEIDNVEPWITHLKDIYSLAGGSNKKRKEFVNTYIDNINEYDISNTVNNLEQLYISVVRGKNDTKML